LKTTLLEETYEVLDAIDGAEETGDWEAVAEELGDLLMNIVLQGQIGAEAGNFWLDDILRSINTKLIRRHPHVFGTDSAKDSAEVLERWDRIKRLEKGAAPETSRLGELPRDLPALMRAQALQRRAARAGFAWTDDAELWAKLHEEIDELAAAQTSAARFEEVGDVLWMVAGLAGRGGIDAEDALRRAAAKFSGRFKMMEASAKSDGRDLQSLGTSEWRELWSDAKQRHHP
jgi:tetrapyrrole methylase family protein/MazG family protein